VQLLFELLQRYGFAGGEDMVRRFDFYWRGRGKGKQGQKQLPE